MRISVMLMGISFFYSLHAHSFDEAIARIYKEKPHLKPEQTQEKVVKKQSINVPALINCTALCYALGKIYCAHQAIFKQKIQTDSGWLFWLCPSSVQKVTRQGQFFVQACGICCEAFAYKLLAQFLYYIYKSEFPAGLQ